MIIHVQVKCPDALERAVEEECENQLGYPPPGQEEEDESRYKKMVAETMELAERWFRYGEVVTLCIDTERGTCSVNEA